MRKNVLFLLFSLLLASVTALYTLHSITPLPIERPRVENGSVALYAETYSGSMLLP